MLAENMSTEAKKLVGIPSTAAHAARELVQLLNSIYGESLLSLTVHGDALSEAGSHHGIESVMVLSQIEPGGLHRLAQEGRRLGRIGVAAPLAMTPEDIASSMDSFPLELLEIQQRHATVHGKDYFADLHLTPGDVRLQCEREFKRILMRLRQAVLTAAGRSEVLDALAHDLRRHLLRTLRGFLWLSGQKQFVDAAAVAGTCGQLVSERLEGVANVLSESGRISTYIDALYKDIGLLAGRADRA